MTEPTLFDKILAELRVNLESTDLVDKDQENELMNFIERTKFSPDELSQLIQAMVKGDVSDENS